MKTFCGKMPGTPCARGAGGGCGNPWWVSLEEQGHGVEKQPLSFLRSDSASVLGEEALHYLSGVYLRWGRRRQPQTCCCGAERSFIASEHHRDLPSGTSDKEPFCQCRRRKRHRFNPWVRKLPWRRASQLRPVFLPGESHGQRSLAGYSP